MVQKIIITEVTCANSFSSDYPSLFGLALDDELKARIKSLAEAARNLNVYAIEEFCYAGVWADARSEIFAEHDIESLSGEFAMSLLRGVQDRVDVPMLRVTTDEFHLTAVPKHGSDELAFTTKRIPLSALESDDTLYLVESGPSMLSFDAPGDLDCFSAKALPENTAGV